jgi:pimeloyl-ACP methyl ester carboxylesterase
MWERSQARLAEQGLASWAFDLPGHGADAGRDVQFEEIVSAVAAAHDAVAQETGSAVAVVGHSMGALAVQVLFGTLTLDCAVLMCPTPPAGVSLRPDRAMLKAGFAVLPALLRRKPLEIPLAAYAATAMTAVAPERHREVHGKLTAWPNRLTRTLARNRPTVAPNKPDFPVLVVLGGKDLVTPPATVRSVGDWYEAVVWRFDDVGHLPPLEPGGERVSKHLAGFLLEPRSRRIHGAEAFAPADGSGTDVRADRDEGRKRVPWERTRLGGQADKGRKLRE